MSAATAATAPPPPIHSRHCAHAVPPPLQIDSSPPVRRQLQILRRRVAQIPRRCSRRDPVLASDPAAASRCLGGMNIVSGRELLNISRTQELMSVTERWSRFLRGIGLDEFLSSQDLEGSGSVCTRDMIGSKRVRESSVAVLDPLSIPDYDESNVSECCIKDLDNGKRFIVQDQGQDGLFCTLKEVGSETLMSVQEFEALLGLSYSIQHLMCKGVPSSREEHNASLEK